MNINAPNKPPSMPKTRADAQHHEKSEDQADADRRRAGEVLENARAAPAACRRRHAGRGSAISDWNGAIIALIGTETITHTNAPTTPASSPTIAPSPI